MGDANIQTGSWAAGAWGVVTDKLFGSLEFKELEGSYAKALDVSWS